MPTARVTFTRIIQDSQEIGSDDDHMVSRVLFDLEYEGRAHQNVYVDVKQPVGGDVETDPLEVGRAVGYRGPGNYEIFRGEVEKYFRGLIGASATGIRVQSGAKVRMRNNMIVSSSTVQFDVTPEGGW